MQKKQYFCAVFVITPLRLSPQREREKDAALQDGGSAYRRKGNGEKL